MDESISTRCGRRAPGRTRGGAALSAGVSAQNLCRAHAPPHLSRRRRHCSFSRVLRPDPRATWLCSCVVGHAARRARAGRGLRCIKRRRQTGDQTSESRIGWPVAGFPCCVRSADARLSCLLSRGSACGWRSGQRRTRVARALWAKLLRSVCRGPGWPPPRSRVQDRCVIAKPNDHDQRPADHRHATSAVLRRRSSVRRLIRLVERVWRSQRSAARWERAALDRQGPFMIATSRTGARGR